MLILVKPMGELAVLTYAGQYSSRIDCYEDMQEARREHPDLIKFECKRFLLRQGDRDGGGDHDGSGAEQRPRTGD